MNRKEGFTLLAFIALVCAACTGVGYHSGKSDGRETGYRAGYNAGYNRSHTEYAEKCICCDLSTSSPELFEILNKVCDGRRSQ